VLAEHLDHPATTIQLLVELTDVGLPVPPGDIQDVLQSVACQLIRCEGQKVVRIGSGDFSEPAPEHPGGLVPRRAGMLDRHTKVPPVGQPQIAQQQTTICHRVGAHASLTGGVLCQYVRYRCASFVE
jgi:hypothetical protein